MTPEMYEMGLTVAGWLVAFRLGRELSRGYAQWRERRAEQPVRSDR